MAERGQAIVELALVMPIVLFGVLGFIEWGFLSIQKAHQDRDTAALAVYAAAHPGQSWNSALSQLELADCTVDVQLAADIYTATATCHYSPRVTVGLWDGLPMTSQEHAAAGTP